MRPDGQSCRDPPRRPRRLSRCRPADRAAPGLRLAVDRPAAQLQHGARIGILLHLRARSCRGRRRPSPRARSGRSARSCRSRSTRRRTAARGRSRGALQYQVGYNLPVGSPGTEGYKLATFQTLKSLADTYSILRTCLERRKNEIRALDWDIVLTADAAKRYQGDRAAMRDFGERQAKAKKFFSRPDPNYYNFESFLHAMMDQVFVIDALSLYMCPKRGRGHGQGPARLRPGRPVAARRVHDPAAARPARRHPAAPGAGFPAVHLRRAALRPVHDGRRAGPAGLRPQRG